MNASVHVTREAASVLEQVIAGSNQTRLTAETLPPATYHSPDFYALEVEAIFRSDWVGIGHVSMVAEVGDYHCVDLVGEPLVIVRGEDRIRVLSRVCQHRWAPVVSGSGRTRIFSCPFHKWAYGLDGQLLAAPFMEASADFDKSRCPLQEIRTEIVEDLGLIFVTLSQSVDSIGERLSDFRQTYARWKMGELATIRTTTLLSEFNWKIQAETFMECYHHIGAHTTTFEVDQPARLSWCEDGKSGWSLCHSPYRDEASLDSRTSGLPVFPDLNEAERQGTHYVNIFPNLLLAIRADTVVLVILFPEGPKRTMSETLTLARPEALADPEAIARSLAKSADFMAQAIKEDNDVNELQQLGVHSRFAQPGRLSQIETTVWDLGNYVRRRVSSVHAERNSFAT